MGDMMNQNIQVVEAATHTHTRTHTRVLFSMGSMSLCTLKKLLRGLAKLCAVIMRAGFLQPLLLATGLCFCPFPSCPFSNTCRCRIQRPQSSGRAIQNNTALPQEPLQEGVLNFEYFMCQQHRDAAQHVLQDCGHFGLERVGAILAVEQTEIVCNPCSWVACLATGDLGLVELVPEKV